MVGGFYLLQRCLTYTFAQHIVVTYHNATLFTVYKVCIVFTNLFEFDKILVYVGISCDMFTKDTLCTSSSR